MTPEEIKFTAWRLPLHPGDREAIRAAALAGDWWAIWFLRLWRWRQRWTDARPPQPRAQITYGITDQGRDARELD